LPSVDGVLLREPDVATAEALARATRAVGKCFWLETRLSDGESDGSTEPESATLAIDRAIDRLLAAHDAGRQAGQTEIVLAITARSAQDLIWAGRMLTARLAAAASDCPLFLRSDPAPQRLIPASLGLGSLLCDGLGDAIQAATLDGGQDETELTLDVLQGAGTRLSKTDYVACPSCGRTLFDLQSTTERIKSQTAHLVGVKIAIMGCVVNGPGEMADADFGYVGGSPGHVNLYVGKNCVERNVPAEVADSKLIELIKAKGRWQEPQLDDVDET
jgi:(E)-4-hydroxy-3-methylbut-2-enyl-diphosphate synthase